MNISLKELSPFEKNKNLILGLNRKVYLGPIFKLGGGLGI
jgi:hypothetical protein